MANTKKRIAVLVIPALIFTFFFFSCKSESAVEPPPVQSGLKGKVVDSTGAALSNVKIWLTFYYYFSPVDSSKPNLNKTGLNRTSLSKSSSTNSYPFKLYQNLPNPVLCNTFFRFSLPSEGNVSFRITDKLTKELVYSYSENLTSGLYQMERNLRDSLKLKNGIYTYTLDFKSKTGESFSDSKELFLISELGTPSLISDAEGNFFLPYNNIFAGNKIIVKWDEDTESEQVLGNGVYVQFQKEGYYTTTIRALLVQGGFQERNIIMRRLK